MGLFRRRPLCFFCMLFLVTSALIMNTSLEAKLLIAMCVGGVSLIFLAVFIFFKKVRIATLTVMLCLFSILLSIFNSAFRINYERQKAEIYVGDQNITASVTDIEYISKNSSAYTVKIEDVSGNETDIKALLVCGFAYDMDIGDMVFADVEIMEMSDKVMGRSGVEITNDKDILLMAVIYEPSDGMIQRFNRELEFWRKPFVKNGISVVVDEMKDFVCDRTYELVGEDAGSIMSGFLIGDTSEVPTNIIRDFRRSGVSHMFAVSGMHISILLGAVDLLLQKMLIHKYIRCAIISVLAFILLIFTGFSMSALRSVLMLWLVYLVFIFSEEADSPTTLFVSITIILLIFPYAVYELGMWMSFLATLGLVTVFPLIDVRIPKRRKGNAFVKFVFYIGRGMLMIAVMTVISNMFLLPIQWAIFGEISAVSIPTNILLSPLNTFLLVTSVICLFFGSIPLIGDAINLSVKCVCWLIVKIVEMFSSLDIATVSLEYEFVMPIVLIFTIGMIAVLTLSFRRKWLVALPFGGFILAFSVSVMIFNILTPRSLTYYGENTKEMISITDGTEVCVVDMSNGAYKMLNSAFDNTAEHGATDVDTLVFTTVSKNHISSMEYFFRSRIIRMIYIPVPDDVSQYKNSILLAELAHKCGVQAYLYENGDIITVGDTSVMVMNTYDQGNESVSVFVDGTETVFGYTDAFFDGSIIDEAVNSLLVECDTVLIGNNGIPDKKFSFDVSESATLIYSSEELAQKGNTDFDRSNTYVNQYDRVVIKFRFK